MKSGANHGRIGGGRMGRITIMISGLVALAWLSIAPSVAMSVEPGKVEEIVNWRLLPDRTVRVEWPGVMFRFHIIDWSPASECNGVAKDERGYVFVAHARNGGIAYRYIIDPSPMAVSQTGNSWRWYKKQTYLECDYYDSENLKCLK